MIYFITDRRPGETPIPPAVLHHALHVIGLDGERAQAFSGDRGLIRSL